MVLKKGKRKLVCDGKMFYWFVRKNQSGTAIIHILSEDKKIHLEYPLFDETVDSTKLEVERRLRAYLDSK